MDQLLLSADSAEFTRSILRAISDGSDDQLLTGIPSLPGTVAGLRESPDEIGDVSLALNNTGALAAIAARQNKPGLFTACVNALRATYRLGDVFTDAPAMLDVQLFEASADTLWCLGASLCAEGRYGQIAELVDWEPLPDGHYDTWFRHGQVMSARAATEHDDDNALDVPSRILEKHDGFDLTEDSDARNKALFGFDLLALLVAARHLKVASDQLNFYPSFAKGDAALSEWVLFDLRVDGPKRGAVFPGSNDDLRTTIREANEMAASQAAFLRAGGRAWNFLGFADARTWLFVREGNLWEDWSR
jgi:hypothetical protein